MVVWIIQCVGKPHNLTDIFRLIQPNTISKKLSLLNSLIRLAINLCEHNNLHIEMNNVKSLQSIGYRKQDIVGIMNRILISRPKPKNNDEQNLLFFYYI